MCFALLKRKKKCYYAQIHISGDQTRTYILKVMGVVVTDRNYVLHPQ